MCLRRFPTGFEPELWLRSSLRVWFLVVRRLKGVEKWARLEPGESLWYERGGKGPGGSWRGAARMAKRQGGVEQSTAPPLLFGGLLESESVPPLGGREGGARWKGFESGTGSSGGGKSRRWEERVLLE